VYMTNTGCLCQTKDTHKFKLFVCFLDSTDFFVIHSEYEFVFNIPSRTCVCTLIYTNNKLHLYYICFLIAGDIEHTSYTLNYCTKERNESPYELTWPKGDYCIFKHDSECPDGSYVDKGTNMLSSVRMRGGCQGYLCGHIFLFFESMRI
jgi:hypothetical protein